MKALLLIIFIIIPNVYAMARPSLERFKPTPMTAQNQLDKLITQEKAVTQAQFEEGTCVLPNGFSHQIGDFDSHTNCASRGGTFVKGNPLQASSFSED